MQLSEQFRPKALSEVVGQTKAIKQIETLQSGRGLGGRAFWLAGLSGTGKTTIAKIIGELVAGEWCEEIDAQQCTPKAISDWRRKLRSKPLCGSGWCLIVNEAHGLRKDSVRQFLTDMEPLPDYACIVFTTTLEGQLSLFDDCIDANPLMSRCTVLSLESKGSQLELAFACHLRKIAVSENLDGRPIGDYVNLVRTNKFNLRSCFQAIEAGEMRP